VRSNKRDVLVVVPVVRGSSECDIANPPKTFATRSNSGAALERITPAGARIYEILHHPEAFTVQTSRGRAY
jgi:hypothetical protein